MDQQTAILGLVIAIKVWVASYFIITRYFEIHFNSTIDLYSNYYSISNSHFTKHYYCFSYYLCLTNQLIY